MHIGAHKTGSTTIQTFLLNNRNFLLAQGIFVPTFDEKGRFFISLKKKLSPKGHARFVAYFEGKIDRHGRRCRRDLLRTSSAPHAIISSENFYNLSASPALDGIADLMPSDTKILCYFRDPVSHAVSLYKQLLGPKAHSRSLSDFVSLHLRSMLSSKGFSYYRYEHNIGQWRMRFQNTEAKVYRKATAAELIERFFMDCQIAVDLDGSTIPQDRNEGLQDEIAALLMRINRLRSLHVIDIQTRESWAKILSRNGQSIAHAIKSRVEWETVDFEQFLTAFAQQNSQFLNETGMGLGERRKVLFPKDLALSDAGIVALMREIECRDGARP
jgi:hypothetical protein